MQARVLHCTHASRHGMPCCTVAGVPSQLLPSQGRCCRACRSFRLTCPACPPPSPPPPARHARPAQALFKSTVQLVLLPTVLGLLANEYFKKQARGCAPLY